MWAAYEKLLKKKAIKKQTNKQTNKKHLQISHSVFQHTEVKVNV